ncbi:MAG TPA: nitroreductase family deazaflavin-dependent oxidoreductase [Solirubrobacteraceae bacterium]|jgi:deazaflavin-dependent oxidoreductase (nitroreductase family)|nr:nitroreductase family deazaflavin-dependent oxidoreductase [Solirubrobacteraceae bacterium]
MGYLDLADRSWPLLRRAMGGHTAVYRLSGGVIGHRVPGFPPMLLLDHVGARSGTRRTSPLVYARDGANVILVASKGGYPKNPAWLHNLKANPDTTIQIGREHSDVRARLATAAEREHLWPLVVGVYGGYEDYQRRTEREIPLVVLEPR